jgi:outer membrane protein TolC
MKPRNRLLLPTLLVAVHAAAAPMWPTNALGLGDALSLALKGNAALLKGRQEIQEAHGLAIQQSAVSRPRLAATGAYQQIDENRIEKVAFAPGAPAVSFQNNQSWNANLVVTQPILAGGRLSSSRRSSAITREAALASYKALVANTLLDVRIAYQDILLAAEQIRVQEASIQLLDRELADTRRRFEAGTVPKFNVLRAEVELANARPPVDPRPQPAPQRPQPARQPAGLRCAQGCRRGHPPRRVRAPAGRTPRSGRVRGHRESPDEPSGDRCRPGRGEAPP